MFIPKSNSKSYSTGCREQIYRSGLLLLPELALRALSSAQRGFRGRQGGLRGRRSAAGPLGTDKLQVRDGQVDCFHLYLLLSPSLPLLLSIPPCSLSLPLKYILLMLRQDYRALSIPWQFMESYGSLFFFCNRKKGLSFPYALCSFSSSDYKGRKWSVFL